MTIDNQQEPLAYYMKVHRGKNMWAFFGRSN